MCQSAEFVRLLGRSEELVFGFAGGIATGVIRFRVAWIRGLPLSGRVSGMRRGWLLGRRHGDPSHCKFEC